MTWQLLLYIFKCLTKRSGLINGNVVGSPHELGDIVVHIIDVDGDRQVVCGSLEKKRVIQKIKFIQILFYLMTSCVPHTMSCWQIFLFTV